MSAAERAAAVRADLEAGRSTADAALRNGVSWGDVERIRDGQELPVKGLCRVPDCDERAFRSGWCHGHSRGRTFGMHGTLR